MIGQLRFISIVFGIAAATVAGAQRGPALKILGARGAAPDVGIKIWVPTGSVRLVAWDRDSIVVRGRVAPSSRFFLARGTDKSSYKLGVEPRRFDGPPPPAQDPSDFVINVPRRAEIAIKTVDATITGDGVGGWFYSVSGAIRLSGAVANVDAESIRGDIDLDVTSMLVKARTGRGHMTVRGSAEDVDASTVSGPLDIASPGIQRGRFSSVTGNIRYAANPVPGSVFDFSDHAGTVEVFLPRTASSRIELSTVTGAIQNTLSDVRPASAGGRTLTVRLGAGEAHMTVRTFKGAIRLLPK
jgi:hypothetical protein